MKYQYLLLLNEMEEEHKNSVPLSANSRILIVDGLNTFIRSFSVDPSSNENGAHVGGITGFLKSIGYAIKVIKPTRVIIVFDGIGGSQKRRKLYPDYKSKRKPNQRYNRAIHITNADDEHQSMKMQMGRLLQYLETLPVKIIALDNIEADDTIAYIVKNPIDNEINTYYIMSSDKDFYQLITKNILVWSPTKKKLYDENAIFEEYGIIPNNFIMYRILDGDMSDNINGIRGVGLKTIKKKLPILTSQDTISLDMLFEHSMSSEDKLCKLILNSKELLERNFQLMQLKDVDISADAKLRIIECIRGKIPQLNNWKFKTMVLEDYVNGAFPNLEYWLKECFQPLNFYAINYAK